MHTTQRLEKETLDRVHDRGKMGESFNGVINRLLDKIDDLEERLNDQEEDIEELAGVEDEPEEN